MKYMGSKSRVAKNIVPIINDMIIKNKINTYVEPFVGGANVIDKVSCKIKRGFDINEYLIALLLHVQGGGKLPEKITKEEYSQVREDFNKKTDLYKKWYTGCVGFLGSYNGRFFDGGYAGTVHTKIGTIRDYYSEARRNLLSQEEYIKNIAFECKDYREHEEFENCLIYCDPPYQGVKQYGSKNFNHKEFWDVVRRWSEKNIVLVSENTAPEDFNCLWEQEVTRTIDNNKRVNTIEKLFTINRSI